VADDLVAKPIMVREVPIQQQITSDKQTLGCFFSLAIRIAAGISIIAFSGVSTAL